MERYEKLKARNVDDAVYMIRQILHEEGYEKLSMQISSIDSFHVTHIRLLSAMICYTIDSKVNGFFIK